MNQTEKNDLALQRAQAADLRRQLDEARLKLAAANRRVELSEDAAVIACLVALASALDCQRRESA